MSVAFARWVVASVAALVLVIPVAALFGPGIVSVRGFALGAALAAGFVLGATQLWALRGAVDAEPPRHQEYLFVLATGAGWGLAAVVTDAARPAIIEACYYVWAEFFGFPDRWVLFSSGVGLDLSAYYTRLTAMVLTQWALAGAAFGAVQGLGLRPYMRGTRWWTAVNALAALFGGLLASPVAGLDTVLNPSWQNIPVDQQIALTVLSPATYAAITGAFLHRHLRRPLIAAEVAAG